MIHFNIYSVQYQFSLWLDKCFCILYFKLSTKRYCPLFSCHLGMFVDCKVAIEMIMIIWFIYIFRKLEYRKVVYGIWLSVRHNCQAPSQIPNPQGPAPTQSNPGKISSKGTGADTKILWATTTPPPYNF